MQDPRLREILEQVQAGGLGVDAALEGLLAYPINEPVENLGFARLDQERNLRRGFPEVIYGQGKTPEQIIQIMGALEEKNPGEPIMATRIDPEVARAILPDLPEVEYIADARILLLGPRRKPLHQGLIQIVCAGTSDMPVAEEAAHTAEIMGNRVGRLYDVGVAGLHRLLAVVPELRAARVIIVVAGMEGALASVVGGLVGCPLIAVPTSVGYGAGAGGQAALLAMLNSCSSGGTVVNIDNGFGAACAASIINRMSAANP